MKSQNVEILEIDRIAAKNFLQEVLDSKFSQARIRSPLEIEVAAEAASLTSHLINADTRTFCILAVSFLEDTLNKNFVEKWSIQDAKAYESYFGANGPIATFSQRTLIARALQWFPDGLIKEIDLLRKIRNVFAHNHRVHVLIEEPLLSYAIQLSGREETWSTEGATLYQTAFRNAEKETKLRMRIYCCVLFAVGQILARSKLLVKDVHPDYREQGYSGLTGIEQDLIDTMVRFCLHSLDIDRTGL